MKKYLSGLYILMTSLFFASCSQEENGLRVEEKSGFQIALADEAGNALSRKIPAALSSPVLEQCRLIVQESATEKERYNGQGTASVLLPVGMYDLSVTYGDKTQVAIDAPCYEGSLENQEVIADELTQITIGMKVSNALLSVNYDTENLDKAFGSYYIMVSVNGQSEIIEKGSDSSVYFPAGSSPVVTFCGELVGTREPVTYELPEGQIPANIAAAKHVVLTLTTGEVSSGVGISVETEVKDITVSETIPLEWLPAPKVSATGFVNNTLDFYETSAPQETSINFEVNQITGLEDLEFAVNFGDEQFQNLNGTYTLSAMTEEDKAKFADAGITIPVKGQTAPKIDFSEDFISQLRAKNDGVVANTITINKVTANNRPNKDESPLVYTINTHKPEFTVNVQPGNCWAWEFTVDEINVTQGDAETIKNDLVYQYSVDGNEWVECKTLDGVGGRIQQFVDDGSRNYLCTAENVPERSYKVRALYRGTITSPEVNATLEEPWLLPNGNMDGWTETTRRTIFDWGLFGTTTYDQPYFLPWNTDENVEQWWDTNNNASMPTELPSVGNQSYKCFPTTTFLVPGNGGTGKAAVIRTINADGFASTSSYADGDNFRGVLYTGTTSDDGTMNEGRPFTSRPQKLIFDYKYSSYDNERFGVYVEIFSGDTSIGYGEYLSVNNASTSDFTSQGVDIIYTNKTLKATSVRIKFCSVAEGDNPAVITNAEVNVPEGSEDIYHIHGGSVLYIDNISFDYNLTNEVQ